MLINNPEVLKSWLVVVLEPLCDADSSALARYVLALLKKDKPEKELKRVMIEQLDVFLGEETKPFVERLFTAISSEEYLVTPPAVVNKVIELSANVAASEINMIALAMENQPDVMNIEAKIVETPPTSDSLVDTIQIPQNDEIKAKEIENMPSDATERLFNQTVKIASVGTHAQPGNHVRSASPPMRAATADKENQPRESRRRRASLRSRSRSRSQSRSNERLYRRSRSRDRRPNEREKNQRQFRNKSPPPSDGRHIGSHERRRGGGGSDRRRIPGSGALDERSPRFGGAEVGRKGRLNRSTSRSPSPSLDRGRNKGSPSGISRAIRGSPDRDRHHHSHTQVEVEKRQRCRDFDEKGYCVRGETCPWDHGVNPVVFEDINNSTLISISLREYNPDAPDLWTRTSTSGGLPTGASPGVGVNATGINPFTGTVRPNAVMMGIAGHGFPPVAVGGDKATNGTGALGADYARSAAGAGFRAVAPMIPFPFNPVATPLQRELIPIPVVDASVAAGGDVGAAMQQQGKRRFELEDSVAIADGPNKRKIPLNSRLGPRMPSNQNNCSLELRKVPRGLNTIAHLNNHFAKFGKIVNIQITYDSDPEAAIVTFSTHAEANVAYRSTEAVLNNRFIKVFWHSNQDTSMSVGSDTPSVLLTGGRKNSQYHLNNVPAIPTPTTDSAKTSNSGSVSQGGFISADTTIATVAPGTEATNINSTAIAATHVPPSSLRLKNTVSRGMAAGANSAIRKKQEEQAKAVVQLANGLRKRKQELLQSYVKQMKSALDLVERCEPNDTQRAKTLSTIKELQGTIDKLRKEIAAEQEQQMQVQMQNQLQPPPAKKTKEQQKKELLDIELELFAQQQEGNDTTVIQRRLEELQRSLGIVSGSGSLTAAVHGGSKLPHFATNRPNPRIRPSFPEGSTRVDRRPKTIVVTGFSSDETDFVLGHFKHFGEITKHVVDNELPQLTLSYAIRVNAEQAVLRGKIFKDKRLQISWAPSVQSNPTEPLANTVDNKALLPEIKADIDATKSFATSAIVGDKIKCEVEAANIDTLPELRLEDEEEDDESEDRSWRR